MDCVHVLPDLAFLEHKYESDPVTFIGVHSAKFTNEASRETIRAAILPYEIQHAVVIDDQMKLWRAYAVRSWPTMVVINPTGRIVATGRTCSVFASFAFCTEGDHGLCIPAGLAWTVRVEKGNERTVVLTGSVQDIP